VRVLSGIGVPHEQIALTIGVDAKTLRKTCRDDLDRGMTEANTKVAQTFFSMATRGDNTAATIFWMKARAGWREKQEVLVEPGTGWFMMGVPEAPSMEECERQAKLARTGPEGDQLKAGMSRPQWPNATYPPLCSPPANDR